MNILFIHPDFPGQFGFLAESLGKDKDNKILFLTSATANKNRQIPGVQKIVFSEQLPGREKNDPHSKNPPGLAVANILAGLKKQAYTPDLIVGHSGTGTSFYVKDIYPNTPFLGFFNWFHSLENPHDDSTAISGPDLNIRMNLRNKNLSILSDLWACDHGICPTGWQKRQFPKEFHQKLSVVHNGVNTRAFQPSTDQTFKTDVLDLSHIKQLITYTTAVLAPYKGFQQFIASLPAVLEQQPDAHAVIVGADRVSFGDASGNKTSYKSLIFEKVKLDPHRVHFIDGLAHEAYKMLLQSSRVHVYLDSPLMVSPSLLEAMSCECLVLAPDMLPVKEVITDGVNGIITDFSSPDKISEKISACLDYPSFMTAVKQKARQTIVKTYAIEKTLPRQLDIIKKMIHQDKQGNLFG
ncbi:glycosyltransferase [Desulfobacula sp.]|uniref:glycosyltransferase n=1 Tax=Desulfobacula sp. TaxID=2593537 RepID=UPI00261CD3CE|nr:glycosyltransferase [Desulfobacula sp.]